MSDYRVTIKVRNARLLRAIESLGHNPGSFAKENGFQPTAIYNLVAMKRSPFDRYGEWRPEVIKICELANVVPQELFTQRQMAALERNTVERELDEAALVALTGHTATSEDYSLVSDARRLLGKAIAQLPERYQRVLEIRGQDGTLEDAAKELGVTRERVRQMEAKAHRELHKKLRDKKDALINLPWEAA